MHFCGLLFEREFPQGQFVVTGVTRGSEASKVHFPVGSILVTVNEIPTHSKTESEFRKLLFGLGGEIIIIGAQPPGWPSVIDVQLPRLRHMHPDSVDYCDGWSEKAFDEEYSCKKAGQWVENNPPEIAEH